MNYLLSFVFDSCDNRDTTGVSSRTGVISAIYKKSNKKDTVSQRPISLLNLDYKIYTSVLKNRMQKP